MQRSGQVELWFSKIQRAVITRGVFISVKDLAHKLMSYVREEDFEEFPDHPELKNFDKSDRKFVAVAVTHPERPPILQGFDSKWWGWRSALAASHVVVDFLCPEEIAKKFEEKSIKR